MKKILLSLILFISASMLQAQDRTLSGTVTDATTGETLPGTSIMVKGTSNGTTTNLDGYYKLPVKAGDVLIFSFIGYDDKEVVVGNQSILDVAMGIDVESLSEVLVIGYGSQKKSVASAAISTADVDAMEKISVPNVGKSLQGLASGVNVSGISGQPTSSPTILIRGVGTNGDNRPLVILDGLQADVSILNSLSPNDIESIQILKDAASTAIYGTSGANGVIVVQTKSGKDGQMEFNYNGSYFTQSPWKVPEMLNATEYIDIINEKYANGGQSPQLGFPEVGSTPVVDTDWMNTIFEPASIQNHNISLSKGNEKGSYFTSVTYTGQEGVIAPEKSYFDRITARFNSRSKINDYLSFGQNVSIIATESSSIPENNEFGTPLGDAIAYDPITPIYDPNAQFGFAQSPFVQKEYVNPLSRIFISNGNAEGVQVLGNLFLDVNPLPWLKLKTDIAFDRNTGTSSSYSPAYELTDAFQNLSSDIAENSYKFFRWQWENYFSINKDIGKNSFELVGGHTAIKQTNKFFGGSGQDLPPEALYNENLRYITNLTPDSSRRAYSFADAAELKQSYFGRILYNYDEKYLATASLRRDGSSKFGSDNRYAFFFASSAGWVISNESFFKLEPIDFLKLRVSFGTNGNDRIPNLAYTSSLSFQNTYQFGDPSNQAVYNGAAPVRISNPAVRWEESRQLDIGIEAKLFDNQVGFEFDVYRKLTDGLLLPDSSTPIFAGNNPGIANVGEVVNSGIEFKIDYYKDINDFSFGASLNGTTLKNRVTKVSSVGGFVEGYTWPIRNANITRMVVGEPLYYFRGYESSGVFSNQQEVFSHINSEGDLLQPNAKPGDLRYVDTDGNGEINVDDYTNIGKPWADFTFGLNLTANYKGFDASMLVSGQFGNQIYRTFERQDVPLNNYTTEWLDRWTEDNQDGTYPRVVSGIHGASNANNYSASSFYVEDADFVRIKNLQVGYNLPRDFVEKAQIKKLRVYVSVDNLLTITGYSGFDPEIGVVGYNVAAANIDRGYYPQTRNIGGGLQITF